ncbi:MAG: UDP-N-acetylglucosamine 1-carboxyvinyltransferase [Myxococcota bacterium]|nr:UDP-N-acetylglucosamine 1-carboxyvinyltransferase [Myxococcota bacterium]
MDQFIIEGGKALHGYITPGGNKNEALPCVCATLLVGAPVTLRNLPRIRDVNVLLDILCSLGATVEELDSPNEVRIDASNLYSSSPDSKLCSQIRASILLAGPLLARMQNLLLPPPGGDVIGRRRVDTHFSGFQSLGATFSVDESYELHASNGLTGADILFDEASVTATENVVMAAVLAKGTTILRNVASEPHVQGLCRMLISMGAHINGVGSNTLIIEGTDSLHGCDYTIGPDYLEVGSMMGLAACTNSDITIRGAGRDDLRMVRMVFEKLGVQAEDVGVDDLRISPSQELIIRQDLHGSIPRIDDAPWPAFPTDLMSIAIVTATQSAGTVLFFEKMYEGRMFFVDHLIGMGAKIILCDPHRVVVVGPSALYGSRVESPDVRAGMALVIAALAAKGQTTIGNIRQIDRGYERLDEKLRALGASIERVHA